jgi:uncharacterized protein (TIGR02246 family)
MIEEEVMSTLINNALEGSKIRALVRDRVDAIRAKDADRAMAGCSPDLLLFDVVKPLCSSGLETARQRAETWFSSFEGPLYYELRDLTIDAGDDVAFSHSLNRVSATRADGNNLDMWWRATVCYRKIDGEWKVTHEHNSVPVDSQTGQAAMDLKP